MQNLKHGTVGPGSVDSKKPRRFGLPNAAAVAVSTAAVAALFLFQRCSEPKTEPICKDKIVTVCPGPTKDNGICETGRAENDSMLDRFSAKDCGICGDGIQNRDGTVYGTEYANLCPVDFHCGNGKVDQNTPYAAMIEDKDSPGTYVWRSVTITESCAKDAPNYCEADCPKEEAKKDTGHRRVKEPKESTGPVAVVDDQSCTPQKCSSVVKPGAIMGRMLQAVNANDLRDDLNCTDTITLSAAFLVSPDGVPKQNGSISATCSGGSSSQLGAKANLKNVTLGAPGGECGCVLPVSAQVPKEGSSG